MNFDKTDKRINCIHTAETYYKMRILFLFLSLIILNKANSQDKSVLNNIDSTVAEINNNQQLKTKIDSTIIDYKALQMSGKLYDSLSKNESEIKKYVHSGFTESIENGVHKKFNSSSAFYFDKNKLIKVEEYGEDEEKNSRICFSYYFVDEKPYYYTHSPTDNMNAEKEKALKDRANLLLTMAKGIINK